MVLGIKGYFGRKGKAILVGNMKVMTGYSYSTKDYVSSLEILQKHPALCWRNCGSNGVIIGKVVFLTIFVNTLQFMFDDYDTL